MWKDWCFMQYWMAMEYDNPEMWNNKNNSCYKLSLEMLKSTRSKKKDWIEHVKIRDKDGNFFLKFKQEVSNNSQSKHR